LDPAASLQVFVCEEQPIVIEGLLRVFAGCGEFALAGTETTIPATVASLVSRQVDVVLIGQPPSARSILPLLAGFTAANRPAPTVLWVSELGEMDVFRALQMGARGILRRTQPVPLLLECLRAVCQGKVWLDPSMSSRPPRSGGSARLTARERQVIEHVCRGLKNKDIAQALSITAGTVKVHLMHIFEKTGVRDRFALALQGQQILAATPEISETAQNPESRILES
jgi:DNA-binding NarL/FixJ family response regulator